jgi:hypothetical protein
LCVFAHRKIGSMMAGTLSCSLPDFQGLQVTYSSCFVFVEWIRGLKCTWAKGMYTYNITNNTDAKCSTTQKKEEPGWWRGLRGWVRKNNI